MFMALIVSDEVLRKAQVDSTTLLIDLACYLFEKGSLSKGQARALTGMDVLSFQREIGRRGITQPYTREDLQEDLDNLGIAL